MKQVVNAVADSLEATVPSAWTLVRHDPIWRNPDDGITLYVFGVRQSPGQFETNLSREDVYEVSVQLVEPSGSQAEALIRDAQAELDFHDKVKVLLDWVNANQTLPNIHSLHYVGISYAPDVRRELFVRYAEMALQARKVATYAP